VYLDNAIEPPTVKSDTLRLMLDHRDRAYIVHSKTLRGVFYVRMGLPDFPFDIQVCSVGGSVAKKRCSKVAQDNYQQNLKRATM